MFLQQPHQQYSHTSCQHANGNAMLTYTDPLAFVPKQMVKKAKVDKLAKSGHYWGEGGIGCTRIATDWTHRGGFLLALVRAPEDVEGAGVGVALVDVHHPQVDVQAARAPGNGSEFEIIQCSIAAVVNFIHQAISCVLSCQLSPNPLF